MIDIGITPDLRRLFAATCAGVLVAVGFGNAQTVTDSGKEPDALENAPWNNRLLVVCDADFAADGESDPPFTFAHYQAMQANLEGYIDRDLILVWLTPSSITSWTPLTADREGMKAALRIQIHDDDTTNLRDRLSCKQVTNQVTLVGKDSGVKRVWNGEAPIEEVFAAIDAMPMRQREMRD
mgnify:CR=1 FL=1